MTTDTDTILAAFGPKAADVPKITDELIATAKNADTMTAIADHSPLHIAIEYLGARADSTPNPAGGTAHGYRYFDDRSGRYWLSAVDDIEALGEQLIDFRTAEELGELDEDDGLTEAHVYDTWRQQTTSLKA